MNRRDFLKTAGGAASCGLGAAQSARPPNIVLIVADDLGFADLGFQGSSDIPTPHLDSLARTGVRFTSGYVSHPFCSPTRAGLMTGRYQQRFGHENNMFFSVEDQVAGLPLTETTLANALSDIGYKTGLVGKWHLGSHPRFHPTRRGFREMYGFVGGGHDYLDPGSANQTKYEHLLPIHREDGKAIAEKEYLTTALGREAAAFVTRHTRDPFFLYLAFNAPHGPLQATQVYLDRFASIADK
ncbi:MAG TPA: sulfatase-like hydrolase/transferase, partial [Bryobacteraceae bacterium]|nr:sulfatase-like hydrolase/transferase [Bryobacteraceae bacterium]